MAHFFGTDAIIYKIVVVGDPRVGKTSIRKRYMGVSFSENYVLTIGADFSIKTMDKKVVQIWDLAGNLVFKNVRSDFYRGAQGALIVFDVTNIDSLRHVINWTDEIFKVTLKPIPLVLVGNKSDLRDGGFEEISVDDAIKYQLKLQDITKFDVQYIETSALTGNNIDMAFENLLNEIDKRKIIK